jgi:hypothetical protein
MACAATASLILSKPKTTNVSLLYKFIEIKKTE